jgi:hypothetical protein
MTSHLKTNLIIELPIIALPYFVWSVLVVLSRFSAANVSGTLRLFRPLRWVLALSASLLMIGALLTSRRVFWMFPLGMSIVCSSFGFAIVEGWVKRKFFPELAQADEPYEWWPTERK